MVISKTRQFSPARKIGSVSGVGSPFLLRKGPMPASGLQTVFSITHPDHSSMYSRLSDITEIEMLMANIDKIQGLAEKRE
jgi:hypothetical protein